MESEEFKGSTFLFTAKLALAEEKAEVPAEPEVQLQQVSTDKNLNNVRILLAEDNIVNQKIAVRMLEKKGWFVKAAENGKQVLEYLDNEKFDLILMDAQMPLLDGYETDEIDPGGGENVPRGIFLSLL